MWFACYPFVYNVAPIDDFQHSIRHFHSPDVWQNLHDLVFIYRLHMSSMSGEYSTQEV